jgi:hypothetical protein
LRSFLDVIKERAQWQIYRHIPRLFAVISKAAFLNYSFHEFSYRDETRIMDESAETNEHCGCYVRLVCLEEGPHYQQDGLDISRLLLKWFIQAAEEERIPLCTNTRANTETSVWADLCLEMGAEEVGTGGAADSDAPEPEEDEIEGFKFMIWKATKESVHYVKD